MVRLSAWPAVGVVEAADRDRLAAEAALTVTFNPELLIVPSVTVIVGLSALYRVITPLFDPDTDATPALKLIVSAVPKLTAVPVLLDTVGWVPFEDVLAPPNVKLLVPV